MSMGYTGVASVAAWNKVEWWKKGGEERSEGRDERVKVIVA